jgi:hypothetical protein
MVRVAKWLTCLVSLVFALAALAPGARAFQATEAFSPKARFLRVWGALWYLRSLH